MRDHDECRASLCLLCFSKTKDMRSINDAMLETITKYFIEGFDINDIRLPTAICSTCRSIVYEYSKGNFSKSISVYDYSRLTAAAPTKITRNSPHCQCKVCEASKSTIFQSPDMPPRRKRGRPKTTPLETNCVSPVPIRVCQFCLTVLQRGKPHHCTAGSRIENIITLAEISPQYGSEKVASSILKDKKESDPSINSVSLATTTGRPMHVSISQTQSTKASLSTSDIFDIQVDMNLSNNQTLRMASHIRKATQSRFSVERNCKSKLLERYHCLDHMFEVSDIEYVLMKGNECQGHVISPTVYCTNIDQMIALLHENRKYSPDDDILYKICLDSGGGFLKLCLSLSNKSVLSDVPVDQNETIRTGTRCSFEGGISAKQFKDTGVKKMLILAITPDVQETYANVLRLMVQAQLAGPNSQSHNLSNFVFSSDLKIANIILGLMSHSSCHPCSWCDIHKSNLHLKGIPRTLKSLSDQFWSWKSSGGDCKESKNFGNVVHLPVLHGDPSDAVIDLLPPPELHLLLGAVNALFRALEKQWAGALKWAEQCHIEREAMHGGSFSGRSCHKLLSNVDLLRSLCPINALPFVDCFKALKDVVHTCFGWTLSDDYTKAIELFKEAYMALDIPVTPKVHCIFHHVQEFCEKKNEGLGRWSEQAIESLHADFKPTWEKYKTTQSNPSFSHRLLQAVREYNAKHL